MLVCVGHVTREPVLIGQSRRSISANSAQTAANYDSLDFYRANDLRKGEEGRPTEPNCASA